MDEAISIRVKVSHECSFWECQEDEDFLAFDIILLANLFFSSRGHSHLQYCYGPDSGVVTGIEQPEYESTRLPKIYETPKSVKFPATILLGCPKACSPNPVSGWMSREESRYKDMISPSNQRFLVEREHRNIVDVFIKSKSMAEMGLKKHNEESRDKIKSKKHTSPPPYRRNTQEQDLELSHSCYKRKPLGQPRGISCNLV
ncbi:hypothetical protein Tco_0001137 [Tanacetum coccineum]